MGNVMQPWVSTMVDPKTTPEYEVKPSWPEHYGFKGERKERSESSGGGKLGNLLYLHTLRLAFVFHSSPV